MSGFSILLIIALALLCWNWLQRRSGSSGRAGFRGGAQSERKLVRLVGKKPADRLIEKLQQRHPERSREWCADKALFDLERDRRY